jgi:hypothetical protein
MLRHYFAPNSAGLFCLLLLFVFQWPMQSQFSYFSGSGSTAVLSHQETWYGLPPLVVVRIDNHNGAHTRETKIQWLNLGLLLAIGYLVTMPLGRLVTGPVFPNQPITPRRPVRTLLLVLASVAVVAGGVTIALCTFYPQLLDGAGEPAASHPWLVVFVGCFTISAIPSVLITLLVMSIRRIRETRQTRRAGFAVLPAPNTDSSLVS